MVSARHWRVCDKTHADDDDADGVPEEATLDTAVNRSTVTSGGIKVSACGVHVVQDSIHTLSQFGAV